jgi:hypothetical protein
MDNDKQKMTEFEDMLWRAYPFMELNSRFYQFNDEYRREKEELAFYKNQVQGLTHQVENQRQEIHLYARNPVLHRCARDFNRVNRKTEL